ncbi:MAG: alpha-glucan family phosphorylase [Ardenticatenaceae bacterium]|nr:alpha-glucan family phosphorylase [Ardenticatenaceae bacterium]
MNVLGRVSVFPAIPDRIGRLHELAYNLWWSWTPEALHLYSSLDPVLWEQTYHNPVKFLRSVAQERLDEAAANEEYLAAYDAVMAAFDAYMNAPETWFRRNYPNETGNTIAYFSAEFGLHESLPIYSGGLGVLAGDHCKGASDLGLPLVGVGFLYPQGYFKQRLTPEGWQEAIYEKINFAEVPATPARRPDGREVLVQVELPGRTVTARVWRIQVGRNPLFLLDTDVDPNAPEDRELAARLYGGDQEMRISQEIILGIGGVRALRALGYQPAVWHLNEGHAAFLNLERLRELVQHQSLTFHEAVEVVRASSIFTTHTPVMAGHDAFPFDLVERYFNGYWGQLGLNREAFLNLARHDMPWGPQFSMTVLALQLTGQHNGVSELHGDVSRRMWRSLWPGTPVDQIPIIHITNGVHQQSWVAEPLEQLFDRSLPRDWRDRLDEPGVWTHVQSIPDEELWQVRRALKHRMVGFVRLRLAATLRQQGEGPKRVREALHLLDPEALTIGFARRFATYKRATLIFRDPERLKRILNDPERPVQLIFAGKAHPADQPGKELIQRIYQLSQQEGFAGRIVLLEDYDINVARHLVQGVDVWLNNPRRPLEASGTSGMKASMNGVANFSVLDGWWREAYNRENGWAIGQEREYKDVETQDEADALSLYATLEDEIVSTYYDCASGACSPRWLATVKAAISTITPRFSIMRVVKEYTNRLYIPAERAGEAVVQQSYALARELARWKHRLQLDWPGVHVEATRADARQLRVGETVPITAHVRLNGVNPDDIAVEVVFGSERDGEIAVQGTAPMRRVARVADSIYRYEGAFTPTKSGLLVYGVRVLPHHEGLLNEHELGLVRWA